MTDKAIGDRELALLKWVADHGPVSVGEASDTFGERNGLARSTVLTMMERLRQKGRLKRRREDGVYRYHSAQRREALLNGVVGQFVKNALGGSVSPFVAYLSEKQNVSAEELAQLEALVERLGSKRKGE